MGDPGLTRPRDRVGEADRVTHLAHPILRISDIPAGDDRDPRLAERQRSGDLAELLEHRLHQPRVERVADPQPPGTLKPLRPPVEDLVRAGHHHRARTVHRRHREPIIQDPADLILARLDREHPPTIGQPTHQPTPRLHQRPRILQREHPRHMRRRQLPDRMTDQETPAAPRRTPTAGRARPRTRTTPAAHSRSDRYPPRATHRTPHRTRGKARPAPRPSPPAAPPDPRTQTPSCPPHSAADPPAPPPPAPHATQTARAPAPTCTPHPTPAHPHPAPARPTPPPPPRS